MENTSSTPHNKEWFNKKRGIYIERIPALSNDWFARRQDGLGATDVGRVMGLNEYEGGSCIEAFYEKIGIKPQFRDENKFTYWGKRLEEEVARAWKYYDGTEEGYVKNDEAGKIIRECRNINGVFSNEKYPFLFTNIDRMINKGQVKLINQGEILEENGVLECKTASSWVAKKWEDGIDPMYMVQAQTQLICTGLEYAEIALLELDSRTLSVFVLENNENLRNQILEEGYKFWYKNVLPAKPLAQEFLLERARGNNDKADKVSAEIERYEPAADSSERYKDFMTGRWLSKPNIMKADEHTITRIIELVALKKLIKVIEPEQLLRENELRELMRDSDTLECGDYGKVTWKSQGEVKKSRPFRTQSFKISVDDEIKKIADYVHNEIYKLHE